MMRSLHRGLPAAAAAFLVWMSCTAQANATKLLRFPDIRHDRIVFSYAGDLWSAGTRGGTAVRLTSHPGLELFAKFSPDGQHIAFTAQYGGDEQVYVMPSAGGAPRQLTFYPAAGPLAERWGWTGDPRKNIPVEIYTNCDSVELLLKNMKNSKSNRDFLESMSR